MLSRALFWTVVAGLATLYYFFFGAGPTASEMFAPLEWWRPHGWALRWLPAKPLADLARSGFPAALLPLGLFMAPALGLLGAGLALFRSAPARASLLAISLSMCFFVYYGYLGEAIWRFFGWRFPAVVLSFSGLVAAITFAPSLLRASLQLGRAGVAGITLAAIAVIFALSTEITGTDPEMAFNVSPWPIVTLFGLLLAGCWIAALHVSAGLGSWLARRVGGFGGTALGATVAAAVGATLALSIFQNPGARLIVGVSAGICTLFVVWLGPRERDQAARNALARGCVGLLLFALIFGSNAAASAFQRHARDSTALELLVALEQHKTEHGAYPDALEQLVPAYLPGVPQPRIGLVRNDGDQFRYTGFGDSYALEFASVQWVQCQYSPPFEFQGDDPEDATDVEGGPDEEAWELERPDVAGGESQGQEDSALRAMLAEHGLNGAWSCSETPPKLW